MKFSRTVCCYAVTAFLSGCAIDDVSDDEVLKVGFSSDVSNRTFHSQTDEVEHTKGAIDVEMLDSEGRANDPLEVTWDEHTDTDYKELVFAVSNVSKKYKKFSASVICLGLLGKSVERDMGDFSLEPGESVDIEVLASELPIHSALIFGQVFLGTRIAAEDLGGENGGQVLHGGLFFRHSEDFETARFYTEKEMIDNAGGQMVSIAATYDDLNEETLSEKIGEVADLNGNYKEVTKNDTGLVLRDKGGTAIGLVTKMTLSVEEVDGSEVEVDDE